MTANYERNGGSRLSGKVNWVEFDAGSAADANNHLKLAEERLRVAMAKQ